MGNDEQDEYDGKLRIPSVFILFIIAFVS